MAKNTIRNASEKLLNATERDALKKLMKVHQPLMKELEKWKGQREKLEGTFFEQIERIGKFLEPYQDPAKLQEALTDLVREQTKALSSTKKSSSTRRASSPSRKPTRKSSSKSSGRSSRKSAGSSKTKRTKKSK